MSDGVAIGAEAFLSLGKDMHGTLSKIKSSLEQKPIIRTVQGTLTIPTGATTGTVVTNERPSPGRLWNILKVVILGTDGHTALAGVIVDVYASAMADQSVAVIDNLILSGGTGNVPSVTTYSRNVEWCMPGEQVFGQIYGATAGQQISLMCRVAEYNYSAILGVTIP